MADAAPAETPLETLLVRYWEHKGKHLRSADQARHALLRWSNHFAGALVSEVTTAAVRDFRASMEDEGLSRGYIRRTMATGQAALNRAYREGEITSVPHVPLPSESEPRERTLTRTEARYLLRAAESAHVRMYLLLAFATAARPEAILELTAFQVDVASRRIRLNPPDRAQTHKRRPTLPMPESLVPFVADVGPGPLVAYQGRRLKSIRRAFNATKRRAREMMLEDGHGADAADAILEVIPYTIRHTVATEMAAAGVQPWEVARWLGHSTGYKTTERYAKNDPQYLGRALRVVDDLLADLVAGWGDGPVAATGSYVEPLRASCVSGAGERLVEPRGIEPRTSTMPFPRTSSVSSGLR